MFGLFDIHPWVGTEHCLREECGCTNDHTGCLWNDGHNECMHPAPAHIVSPLLTNGQYEKVEDES